MEGHRIIDPKLLLPQVTASTQQDRRVQLEATQTSIAQGLQGAGQHGFSELSPGRVNEQQPVKRTGYSHLELKAIYPYTFRGLNPAKPLTIYVHSF